MLLQKEFALAVSKRPRRERNRNRNNKRKTKRLRKIHWTNKKVFVSASNGKESVDKKANGTNEKVTFKGNEKSCE